MPKMSKLPKMPKNKDKIHLRPNEYLNFLHILTNYE